MTQILRSMLLMGLTCTVSIVPASLLAAAAAGKVMYAIGEARAIDTSGSPRSVRRGDEFVSGERLVTGEGRMQIRFTDGGLVSLQPRTEFEINDYNYEGKTDGSERGFFSLLRGGVRAVTGFVGRANRDRYRVKTRFATIGIRGTAYKARVCQSDCAKPDGLYASGGEGVIVVFNDGGELELTHGQRLYVRDIAAPPTPTDVDPDVADIPPPAENVEELGPVTATTAAASGGAPLVSSIGDALFQASVAEVSTIRPISRGIITGTGSVTLIGDLDFFELDASESGAFIEGGTVDGAGLATLQRLVQRRRRNHRDFGFGRQRRSHFILRDHRGRASNRRHSVSRPLDEYDRDPVSARVDSAPARPSMGTLTCITSQVSTISWCPRAETARTPSPVSGPLRRTPMVWSARVS